MKFIVGYFTRSIQISVVGVCFALVNVEGNYKVFPGIGKIMLLLGFAIVVNARFTLKNQWRGRPEARDDHKLITEG